ncbi:MAG: MarR family transcriptional regulator [Actinomycetia bacterium]|nr:MarR family transcriptional regulator [Actinomycetes bacterium]
MDGPRENDLSESARLVLAALRGDPTLTIKRITQSTKVSERQIARALSQLRERGSIRREGGDRYGKWIIIDR